MILLLFLNEGLDEFRQSSGGKEFHIFGETSEKALYSVFFLWKHCGFSSRDLALRDCLQPPDFSSFWAKYLGVLKCKALCVMHVMFS